VKFRDYEVMDMHKRTLANRVTIAFIVALFIGLVVKSTLIVRAFQVPALPGGNLLINPWFRSFDDSNYPGLDGWTDAAGLDKYWSSSQKESNPAPDIVIHGICSFQPVYCGTAARLSDTPGQSGGVGIPGVDAYLYQVVSADSSKRKLKFFTHWVSHLIDPAEVVIYGGNSSNGPWTKVWVPFHVVQDEIIVPPGGCTTECLWEETGWLETVLPQGYSHYKVEIHARLPVGEQVIGFKITGIYFAVVDANSNVPTPTATPPSTTKTPSPGTATPGPTPTKTATPLPMGKEKAYIPAILNNR
jgi:hypothetical protein